MSVNSEMNCERRDLGLRASRATTLAIDTPAEDAPLDTATAKSGGSGTIGVPTAASRAGMEAARASEIERAVARSDKCILV